MDKVNTRKIATPKNTPASVEVRDWQQQLVRRVLQVLAIVGALALGSSSYNAVQEGEAVLIPFYAVVYAFLLLVTFWRRTRYVFQAGAILGGIYALGVVGLIEAGLSGDGRVFLIVFPVVTTLFFGQRGGILSLVLAVLTVAAFGWAFSTGRLFIPIEEQANSANSTAWFSGSIVFLMLGTLLLSSLHYLLPRLSDALIQSRKLTQELEIQRATLEERVMERTAALERRSVQLETAAQVARDAAAIRDVEQLLEETVRLVSDRFGFFHTGIFLLDEAGEYAVLRAASSEDGQRMLARGRRLKVGGAGIVGYVTGRGEHRIALDAGGTDVAYSDNPDMPDTRSEMALPLRVRGNIIGALDVQSKEPQAFDEEDVAVLHALADQIAMALSNARLLQQLQESLARQQRTFGELSNRAWADTLQTQSGLSYRYTQGSVTQLTESSQSEQSAREVSDETQHSEPAQALPELNVPLKVREYEIGTINVHKPSDAGDWTPEEMALLETMTDQLGVALESARLYQDAQRRAARERLVSDVTTRMRETLDVDTVLQTAVREMRQVLGLHDVTVRLEDTDAGSVERSRRVPRSKPDEEVRS